MSNVLLEVGSNLFELIEFSVSNQSKAMTFGVNVAKVREVIRMPEISPCLSSSPEILGIFNLRGQPVPAIHLARSLGVVDDKVTSGHQVIVTEFLNGQAGFIVSSAKRIRRVGWDKILPPNSDAFRSITGMLITESQEFIFILDFEQILMACGGIKSPSAQSEASLSDDLLFQQKEVHGHQKHIILVDDSATARKTVREMLRPMGVQVSEFQNGLECWNAIQSGRLDEVLQGASMIISDVEMPQMDGYTLCVQLRQHAKYGRVPLVLHSSLSGKINQDRAAQSGAECYVGKFNARAIMEAVNRYCSVPIAYRKSS